MGLLTSRKTDTGGNREKSKGLTLMDLLVPGLFALILILLTIFVYIPSISEAGRLGDEKEEIIEEQEKLQANLDAIKPLIDNKVKLQQDLKKTQRIIPRQLEVADFAYYVDKLARDSGLTFDEISQSNTSKRASADGDNAADGFGSYVSAIAGPISYKGSYSQIVEFLDQLQLKSPYLIQAANLELRESRDGDDIMQGSQWSVELNLTGYYINQDSNVTLADINSRISPYTDSSDLLSIFNYKNSILDNRESTE